MKLYSFSGSCALATHIVLTWIGKPFEVQLIQKEDLAKPEMRELNPNGQVPILDEDGWVLYENAAILGYLADKFPEAKLGGDGTLRGRAEVMRWLAVINSDMHPAFKPLFGTTGYLGDEAMIEKTKDNARQRLRVYFELMDKQLGKHDWLAGQRSIADPYLFTISSWLESDGVDPKRFPKVLDHRNRMAQRPAVQRVLPLHA